METLLTMEAYAEVLAAVCVARNPEERGRALAERGLTEERWTVEDSAHQAALSAALDRGEGDDSKVVSRFHQAFAEAQKRLAPSISLRTFAEVTRLIKTGVPLPTALSKVGTELSAYVQASAHYTSQMVTDPAVAAEFDALVKGR